MAMTHEEVKAAVLAECERLCLLNGEFEFYPLLRIEQRHDRYSIFRLTKPRTQASELCTLYLDSDADDIQFEIAYRLLGLNKPPSHVDFSPIRDQFEVLERFFKFQSTGEAQAWYMLSAYLVHLEAGLKPPVEPKWEKLKAEIKACRKRLQDLVKNSPKANAIDVWVVKATNDTLDGVEQIMKGLEEGSL